MSFEGLQLGHYQLTRLIGSGGMGEVYQALDMRIQRQVAMKVIRSEQTPYSTPHDMQEALRLFQREMKAISSLDHPRILPLYDFGEETIQGATVTYMVMPLREEGSLSDWLKRRGTNTLLAPEDVAALIMQAADALQYAHNHRIIHQDVKLSNFLVRSDRAHPGYPDLLLADFGIAKLDATMTTASQSVRGTPTYMAPEQWEGQPVPATDQYALAIMAYQLLTGRPPFTGRMEQVMRQHFTVQPQAPTRLNPTLPSRIDGVILKALAKQTPERYPSIIAFAHELQQAVQQSPDLRATLSISAAEAQLGGTRTLQLPTGQPITITIPPNSTQGQVLRVDDVITPQNPAQGGKPGAFILTLHVLQESEPTLSSNIQGENKTYVTPAAYTPVVERPLTPSPFPPLASPPTPPFTPSTAFQSDLPQTIGIAPYAEGHQQRADLIPPPPPAQAWQPLIPTIGTERPVERRDGKSRGLVIALASLAVLVVLASTGFFVLRGLQGSPQKKTQGGTSTTISSTILPTTTQAAAPTDQQVMTMALTDSTELSSLDPAQTTSATPRVPLLIYSGLVGLDDKLNVVPELAESWQTSSDGLTWTFHLRDSMKFSDGQPLTSKDIAYSIDRALQPATKSPYAFLYLSLLKDADQLQAGKIQTLINDSILTPTPTTLVLKTSRPAPYFLTMLASSPVSAVVEKTLVDKYGLKFGDHLDEGGCSGPFKVSQSSPNAIIVVPNPDYYGPQPKLQKLTLQIYQDSTAAYQSFIAGSAAMVSVPNDKLTDALTHQDTLHQVPTLDIRYVGMNYQTKPFDNNKIRQAFALAVNKQTLVDTIWKSSRTPTNHILPPQMPGSNPNLTAPGGGNGLTGNASMAKTLLQQGLQEEGITQLPSIKLSYITTNTTTRQEAEMLQQMWQNTLNVTVNLDGMDSIKFFDALYPTNPPNKLQMWLINYIADYPDPQDMTTAQFDPNAGQDSENYGQNSSASIDEQKAVLQQLASADSLFDKDKRLQQYSDAEQKLVNDVVWIPLYQEMATYLLNPKIANLTVNAMDIIPTQDWSNIYVVA